MSLKLVIFFNFFKEHFLSPAIKHKIKFFSVLKRRLFTIAPISQFSELAASIAVLAEVFNSITSREPSKSLSAFCS